MSELSQEQKKVIEQVQKLLALSKSANENEAALALAKAEELLEKYRLDMTAIEMMGGEKELIVEEEEPLFDSENIARWESALSHGIAFVYGCTTIRVNSKVIKVIGRPSDIMFVRYFVTYITMELFRIGASSGVFYKKRQDWKDSWFMGAVDVILKRVREAQENTQKKYDNPYAVVTLNTRYEDAMAKLHENYPDVTYGKPSVPKKFNEDAYYRGCDAGRTIKLRHDATLAPTKPTLQNS